MEGTNSTPPGSGKLVDDLSPYCEGDIEPQLSKRIRTLIYCEKDYMVYLDDGMAVQWSLTASYGPLPEEFAGIANAVGHLETIASGRLNPEQYEGFARLLGEAMARIIGDRDPTEAKSIIANAESFLDARSTENARTWHILAAMAVTGASLVALLLLWLFRRWIVPVCGPEPFDIAVATLIGSVGALLSILLRIKDLNVNAASGPFIHRLEGGARIIVGMIGAFIVALGVRSDLILGYINSVPHSLAALIAVCAISGASERIVRASSSKSSSRVI
jgi:hypothetical protein